MKLAPRTVSSRALGGMLALGLAGTANAGWQGRLVVDVPTGMTDYFVHYPCRAQTPVAHSGGFLPNLAAKPGLIVLGNGPRLDEEPPVYNEWSWIFDWPNGAPAGSQIEIDVYCAKK